MTAARAYEMMRAAVMTAREQSRPVYQMLEILRPFAAVLEAQLKAAAYDDALGVTAAFNRNVLRHVNSIVGTDFDPAAFAHVAFYNEQQSRIEMHLAARSAQRVRIDGTSRDFATGDLIHTEHSYKYAPAEFTTLLHEAGFASVRLWQDHARDFAVYWAA